MKFLLPSLLLIATSVLSLARSVDEVKEKFLKRKLELESIQETSLTKLKIGYLKRLSTLKVGSQKAGKLDEIELLEKEEQQIQQDRWPLAPLQEDSFSLFKSSREKYEARRIGIEKEFATSFVSFCESIVPYLEKRKIELTKTGALGEARKAKNLADEILQSPAFVAAKNLQKQGEAKNNDGILPALRIRRFGDQLEVLVSRDLKGNISLASPVTNVVEETYGKKELGETIARTLGEFVGAKGYEVAPYRAYHAQYDRAKSSAGIYPTGMKLKTAVEESSRKGLKITLINDGKPPVLLVRNVLPNHTVRGQYRVSCTYFLPRESESLQGFILCQGQGDPIGGHHFRVRDKWTTKVLESATLNHHYNLALLPELKSGKIVAEAAGEVLYLETLSVDQIVFSAFIHTRFDDAGNAIETFPNFRDQPAFVSNGYLVSK